MELQDARKAVKEGWRAKFAIYTGTPEWWKHENAKEIRRSITYQARDVLTQQTGERVTSTQGSPVQVPQDAAVLVAPVAALVTPRTPGVIDMRELRAQAHAKYPVPSTLPQAERKKLYHKRRAWLVAHGAPKRGLLPGQVVFGKKLG
jgi:hypothetical protein